MASRQNREVRPEYPTGHVKGNDSPPRDVPRVPGGANPVEEPTAVDVPSFGAPMGETPVDTSRDAERERKLATTPKPGEAGKKIDTHIQEGIDETLRADLETQADARTGAETESPTEDLSAMGAGKRILERRNPETPGR